MGTTTIRVALFLSLTKHDIKNGINEQYKRRKGNMTFFGCKLVIVDRLSSFTPSATVLLVNHSHVA